MLCHLEDVADSHETAERILAMNWLGESLFPGRKVRTLVGGVQSVQQVVQDEVFRESGATGRATGALA